MPCLFPYNFAEKADCFPPYFSLSTKTRGIRPAPDAPGSYGQTSRLLIVIQIQLNRHLPPDCLVERYQRLCTRQSQRLQLVMYNTKQVIVVTRKNLDEHVILASRKVTLHYFRYLLQSFHYLVERLGVLQKDNDLSACIVSHLLRVDYILRTL